MEKTIERQKAEKYVTACGTPEKALAEIDALIDQLQKSYPTAYDYHSSKNYQSVTSVRTEIEKLKYINWKPSA